MAGRGDTDTNLAMKFPANSRSQAGRMLGRGSIPLRLHCAVEGSEKTLDQDLRAKVQLTRVLMHLSE
jgi:hypothetical protein